MVGTSGANGLRFAAVTASARTRPARTCGNEVLRTSYMKVMLPAITSVSAWALPLYGTCCICTPVKDLNTSPDRWLDAPLPAEPKVTLPGLARAKAIRSWTVLAG